MRAAVFASLLSLAMASGAFVDAARAEGVRLSAQGSRIRADAMSVYGRVCRPLEVALPHLELRIVDRMGEVVATEPLELHEPSKNADGCAYYGLAVQIGLTESAEVCITDVGEKPNESAVCAPRLKG